MGFSTSGCSYFLLLLDFLATISKPELLEQDDTVAHSWHSRKIIQRSNPDQLQMCFGIVVLTSARKQVVRRETKSVTSVF